MRALPLVLVQLAFACLALLLAKLDWLLTRCRYRLVDNEPPKVDSDAASSKLACDSSLLEECKDDPGWFLNNIENTDDNTIRYIREQLEATALGQKYVAESRRLYAVLRPTRVEDMRRIENITAHASHSEILPTIHSLRASMCS